MACRRLSVRKHASSVVHFEEDNPFILKLEAMGANVYRRRWTPIYIMYNGQGYESLAILIKFYF